MESNKIGGKVTGPISRNAYLQLWGTENQRYKSQRLKERLSSRWI